MKIKDLLTDESKWTKGLYARDERGQRTSVHSSRAVRWCLIGALIKVNHDSRLGHEECRAKHLILHERCETRGFYGVAAFNDHPKTTFADVRALLEEVDV